MRRIYIRSAVLPRASARLTENTESMLSLVMEVSPLSSTHSMYVHVTLMMALAVELLDFVKLKKTEQCLQD